MNVNKTRIETGSFGLVASCRLRELLRENHHLSCDLAVWRKFSEPASASL